MLTLSLLVRLASRLHAVWAARAAPVPDPEAAWLALDARLRGVARLRRQYRLAVERKLWLAAPVVLRELNARTAEVRDLLGRMTTEYAPTGFHAPGVAEWVRELRHLGNEFGGVEVRWGDAAVRVVTPPIVLRGVDLGPFGIEFVWTRLAARAGASCFDVIALDPHPAAGRADAADQRTRHRGAAVAQGRQAAKDPASRRRAVRAAEGVAVLAVVTSRGCSAGLSVS